MRQGSSSARGFTYLMLLWWIAISGVMLAALGQSWAIEARRQREAELVFRGEQILRALTSYRLSTPEGQPSLPLRLEELLDDRRSGASKRHLRQLWPDPITGEAWAYLLEGERIRGVYSQGKGVPLSGPPGAQSYEEWRFELSSP